jgi:hypothetical protein
MFMKTNPFKLWFSLFFLAGAVSAVACPACDRLMRLGRSPFGNRDSGDFPAHLRGDLISPPAGFTAPSPPATTIPAETASTNAATATVAPAEPIKPAMKKGEYLGIGFDKLSGFDPGLSAAEAANAPVSATKGVSIPDNIRQLNGTQVSVKGFMLPLKIDNGIATEFLLLKDQSLCCYGKTPKLNEWISVRMTGKGVKPVMDQPISVCGTLHVVGTAADGTLTSIYQIDCEKMTGPEK